VHRHQPLVQAQANWWESRFKLDIPEFNGGVYALLVVTKFRGRAALSSFLDWIAAVEEVLDFKGVRIDEFLWSRPNSGKELQRGGSN
jgi:hypothetical protein